MNTGAPGPIGLVQALILAVLQGVTELFPVSSLGHAVVVPHLLRWSVDGESPSFLPFLVTLHLGTALALLVYFRDDWWALLSGLTSGSPDPASRQNRYLLGLLVLGTVPAGLIGLALEKRLAGLFGQEQVVAAFLVLNGVVLFAGEWLRRRERKVDLAQLRPWQAVAIGVSQAIALLPGFSRSGATMVGGLLVGLNHQAAARFGFLLSTPIILAAALLELPKLARPELRPALGPALAGGLLAGLVAYVSTAALMRYFKANEVNALFPFGAYCVVLGLLALAIR
jgi:undecaprenyl-diphosphatase